MTTTTTMMMTLTTSICRGKAGKFHLTIIIPVYILVVHLAFKDRMRIRAGFTPN